MRGTLSWWVGVAVLAGVAAHPGSAAAQLASRPAAEWTPTLEAPARVAGLKIEEVVRRLKLKDGDVVADLGAGSGLFEAQLAYAVGRGRVYAVELDQAFLDEIVKKVDALHIATVETVLGTPTDPRLPTRSVDVAFFHDVLHHVEDRRAYIRSVASYLRPSGRIAVVEFHPKDSPHRDQPALVVSKEQSAAMMAEAGFVPVEDIALFNDKWFVIYARRP